ncbi:MAG: HEAT repeat domain-containing protein [Gemmataceae bacterium]
MRQGWLALLLLLAPVASAQETKEPDKKAERKFGIKEDRPDTSEEDRKMLREIGQGSDGPALLEYFRKRTYKEADPKAVTASVKDLADEDFEVREKAYARLLGLGASALVGIKEAEKSPDTEVKRRAEELRIRIEASAQPNVQSAVARLVGKTRPAGAAEVLLNYIPFAADNNVVDEICIALGEVANPGGKVDPAVIKALDDERPIKRAAAGEALMRAGVKDELPSVRKLLKDKEATVRLRAGLSLARVYEKDALPPLVDLMKELNPEQLWPVEEILVRLAGEKAPQVSLGTNDETRKKAHAAWSDWLGKNMASIDLAKIDSESAQLGYTLIVMQNFGAIMGGRRLPNQGEVMELDVAKKVRWKFNVTTYPVDAVVTGADSVLVCEFHGAKISERDTKGNVKWDKNVGGNPIGVQKLPGGNIFVVMQNRLLEMDRMGKEIYTIDRPGHDIFRARKLRSGDVAFVTNTGQYVRMDPKTKAVVKSFAVGQIPVLFGSIDVLASGHVVVPDFNRHRVVEFDADGKEVKAFNVLQFPNSVQRLPNGNTLVSSQNTRRVVEYDRTGTEVWSHNITDGQPFVAHRR